MFAWGDLRNVRAELLRQLREQTSPDDWMEQLVEYRILNYSTALKLYGEYVTAQVNRTGDRRAQESVQRGDSRPERSRLRHQTGQTNGRSARTDCQPEHCLSCPPIAVDDWPW